MNKYIDAERLKCELEKRLKNVRDYMNGAGMKYKGPKYYKAQGKESAYDALLSVIDSLQQEQPEVFDTVAFQKGVQEGRRLEREDVKSTIQSRIDEILGDAQPNPILRMELNELIKKIEA